MDTGEEVDVQCYVIDNGERVLSLRESARSMGLTGADSNAVVRNPHIKWIDPYLSEDLKQWLYKAGRNELPDYINDKGRKFRPFEASLFVDLCKAYIDASRDGKLPTAAQENTANRMYAIMTAFAKTGLIQ